jgi:hypothetical protein
MSFLYFRLEVSAYLRLKRYELDMINLFPPEILGAGFLMVVLYNPIVHPVLYRPILLRYNPAYS